MWIRLELKSQFEPEFHFFFFLVRPIDVALLSMVLNGSLCMNPNSVFKLVSHH